MGTFFLLMLVWLIVFLATRNSAVGNLGCCTLIVIFAIVTCVEYDDGEDARQERVRVSDSISAAKKQREIEQWLSEPDTDTLRTSKPAHRQPAKQRTFKDYYDSGFDDGYDEGRSDAMAGKEYGANYDDWSGNSDEAKTYYEKGYEAGYELGYKVGSTR